MSVLWECNDGWLISHNDFVRKTYQGKHQLRHSLFDIRHPYKIHKKKQKSLDPSVKKIKESFEKIVTLIKDDHLLSFTEKHNDDHNKSAKQMADECTNKTQVLHNTCNMNGGNTSSDTVYPQIKDCNLLIPKSCKFICGDVRNILQTMEDKDFDLIILDPPWWNKYIRRKNTKDPNGSYKMLYNEEITNLPIGHLMSSESLIAVWCTNSTSHENDIITNMFPAWGVTYVATWFWIKVTKSGEPICPFTELKGKQPFERLLIGLKDGYDSKNKPIDGKIFISVPSALHSHKPPLNDLLAKYIGKSNPKCLEVFARYLLSNTTSIGFEPLRWQHIYLYTDETICNEDKDKKDKL